MRERVYVCVRERHTCEETTNWRGGEAERYTHRDRERNAEREDNSRFLARSRRVQISVAFVVTPYT